MVAEATTEVPKDGRCFCLQNRSCEESEEEISSSRFHPSLLLELKENARRRRGAYLREGLDRCSCAGVDAFRTSLDPRVCWLPSELVAAQGREGRGRLEAEGQRSPLPSWK